MMETKNVRDVPVVCHLCGTRLHVKAEWIGKQIKCPDCESVNEVKAPKPKKTAKPVDDGTHYKLSEGVDQPEIDRSETVSLICITCHELLHAKVEDAGKSIKCPECETLNRIPRARKKPPAFVAPDASDLIMDAPPADSNEARKEAADRLMADATDHIRERQAEEDIMPSRPFITGVVNYPIYFEIIPIWFGTAIAIAAMVGLINTITALVSTGALMMVMAAFVTVITTFLFVATLLMFCPAYMEIIENAAVGHDKIKAWPKLDMMDRFHPAAMLAFAFALGSLPGMAVVLPLKHLGVPVWLGFIPTPIFTPLVLLSMLDANSLFGIITNRVRASVRWVQKSWIQFWFFTTLLIGLVALTWWSLHLVNPFAANLVGSFLCGIVAVIYCRFLGRLAWVISDADFKRQQEIEDDE